MKQESKQRKGGVSPTISTHPMHRQIIEAYARGESARAISGWVKPPVSHVTLSRYLRLRIRPAIEEAEQVKNILEKQHKVKNEAFTADETVRETPLTAGETGLPDVIQTAERGLLVAGALRIRENRVRLHQNLSNRLVTVVNERAKDMSVCEWCRRPREGHPWEEMREVEVKDPETGQVKIKVERKGCDVYREVPGGTTGLVVRKYKAHGTEYAVDNATLQQLVEFNREIGIELGQREERVGNGMSIQIVCPAAPEGRMPRVRISESGLIEDEDGIATVGLLQAP